MGTLISRSPEETMALGAEWGRTLPAGSVVGLSGDLGAGKTQLVKGIAAGLGVRDRVHSPTFALMNEYQGGRLNLVHLDLYRLQGSDEIIRAGLETYLRNPPGLAVVEWIDRWFDQGTNPTSNRPATRYLHVVMEALDENSRRITYEHFGD